MRFSSLILLFNLSVLSLYAQVDTLIDQRDGQSYTTVKIGQDIWMQENLRFIHPSAAFKTPKKKLKKFGNFYNRSATDKLCPDGWHIPLLSEWDTMIDFLINERKIIKSDYSVETKEEKVKIPKGSEEIYNTRYFVNGSKQLDLFNAPLFLNSFGWIENGKRFKKLKTANLWVIDDKENLINFHIHAGRHNFNSHAHTHHINDTKKRKRYLSVRCVKDQNS